MNTGAYRLLLYLSEKRKIKIGAFGEFIFGKGWYVYTGSAMTNLKQRVNRHKSNDKKLRWHIDYLLNDEYCSIEDTIFYPSEKNIECELNAALLVDFNVSIPVKGFGSSDCNVCPAHLVYFGNVKPNLDRMKSL